MKHETSVQGLGLGCWSYGGTGNKEPDDEVSISIIRRALDLGITHLDSAHDYGNGRSETVIGLAIENRRDDAYIATKAHLVESVAEVAGLVELSRQRLKVETIDLFYIHWPRAGIDVRPMIEGLENARSRGQIRHIGVSNFDVSNLEEASKAGNIDVLQLGYNLLWRDPEKDVFPWCRTHGVQTIAYSPIAQGLLSDRGTDLSRWDSEDPRNRTVYYRPDVWTWLRPIVEKMQVIAHNAGTTLSDLALRWILNSSSVNGAVAGAGSLAQIEAHRAVLEPLVDESHTLNELEALSDEAMSRMPDVGNIFLYHP